MKMYYKINYRINTIDTKTIDSVTYLYIDTVPSKVNVNAINILITITDECLLDINRVNLNIDSILRTMCRYCEFTRYADNISSIEILAIDVDAPLNHEAFEMILNDNPYGF